MAGRVRTRLTKREGRRFGFTVGAAFAALALFLWWRGHDGVAVVAAVPAAALVLAAAAAPTRLGPVERGWMRLAELISRVTTPVFLGLVYFGVFATVRVLLFLFGKNPLVRPEGRDGYWVARPEGNRRSDLQRQF